MVAPQGLVHHIGIPPVLTIDNHFNRSMVQSQFAHAEDCRRPTNDDGTPHLPFAIRAGWVEHLTYLKKQLPRIVGEQAKPGSPCCRDGSGSIIRVTEVCRDGFSLCFDLAHGMIDEPAGLIYVPVTAISFVSLRTLKNATRDLREIQEEIVEGHVSKFVVGTPAHTEYVNGRITKLLAAKAALKTALRKVPDTLRTVDLATIRQANPNTNGYFDLIQAAAVYDLNLRQTIINTRAANLVVAETALSAAKDDKKTAEANNNQAIKNEAEIARSYPLVANWANRLNF